MPGLEPQSSKCHVTSFLESFCLMSKLCCQESVKILSSLIMQFLSINVIPPAPGETAHALIGCDTASPTKPPPPVLRGEWALEVPTRGDPGSLQSERMRPPRATPGRRGVHVGLRGAESPHLHFFGPKYIPVGGCGILSTQLSFFK